MLFSEIYGSYYTAVAQILSRAVEGSLTGKELTVIVQETAFGESLLTIPSALKEERWPFLDLNLNTPVQHEPAMPLSALQKQWMKALLQDPRIRLFSPSEEGLEDVEPLYDRDTFVFFDRYTDGDDFTDPKYVEHFRLILRAMREGRWLRVRFHGHRGNRSCILCTDGFGCQ